MVFFFVVSFIRFGREWKQNWRVLQPRPSSAVWFVLLTISVRSCAKLSVGSACIIQRALCVYVARGKARNDSLSCHTPIHGRLYFGSVRAPAYRIGGPLYFTFYSKECLGIFPPLYSYGVNIKLNITGIYMTTVYI